MPRLARFIRRREGVIAVELALAVPLLLVVLLGGVELGRLTLLNLKLEHAANGLADLVTRDDSVSTTALDAIFATIDQVVAPFEFAPRGVAFVSAVSKDEGAPPKVFWQVKGPGALDSSSRVGAEGGAATVPAEVAPADRQTVVVAELVYSYQPMFARFLSPTLLRKQAYYKPRAGSLRRLVRD